jgi:hypothetical protein
MRRRVICVNPATGVTSYFEFDDAADAMHFTEEQDVTALLEWNRKLYNEAPDRWGDGAVHTSMPVVLREKLKREGIIRADGDDTLYKRWVNDPDNRGWRRRPGRV